MIYLLDHRENVLGSLPKVEILEAVYTERLQGLQEFGLSGRASLYSALYDAEFIAINDPTIKNRMQMFKMMRPKLLGSRVGVQALHVAHDDLSAYGYCDPYNFTNEPAQTVLTHILKRNRWTAGHVDNANVTMENEQVTKTLDAFNELLAQSGLEPEYVIEFKNKKIVSRRINLWSRRGKDTNKRFVYGNEAISVKREEDAANIYTAIYALGQDKLTAYVSDNNATLKYGYSDGAPRVLVESFDAKTSADLNNEALRKLQEVNRPKLDFEFIPKNISGFGLGDRVNVIRHDLGIYYTARLHTIKHDLLNPLGTVVEIGDNIDYSRALKKPIIINQIKESIPVEVIDSATGTAYKWEVVVTDGTPSIKLNEVTT